MWTKANPLGGMSVETFLRDYWQKKPLLIRQAFTDFTPPLSIDELAGLACEDRVESRLVMEQGPDQPWQLFSGPFEAEFLQALPEKDWTLLVQAVDHWVPEVAELLELFRFLPQWRLDDVMVSYAPTGGSVGPHFDYYDVFLLQASGQRRWQLAGWGDESTPVRSDTRLKLMTEFEVNPEWDWVLEPGDLLYLPPQLAHWGVSCSQDCTTWSVGFRGLSAEEILCGAADFLGEHLTEDQRYSDPDLTPLRHSAEIDSQALARVQSLLTRALDQPDILAQWFGRAMTQTKYPDQLLPPEQRWEAADLHAWVETTDPLYRTEGSRFAFHPNAQGGWLFVDGEAWPYPATLQSWVEALCEKNQLDADFTQQTLAQPEACTLLLSLLNQGSLYAPEDE